MLKQVMDYCNNHFVKSVEGGVFSIVSDGITGNFSQTYIAGQYLWIKDSYLNDGVYKITAITSGKLTLEGTLNAENTGNTIYVHGCSVPSEFVTIATEIAAYKSKDGISSESIDDYSVSFVNGGGWQQAYSSRLSAYKQIFERVLRYGYR